MSKFVYLFSEGNGKMRELLGGKGANLAEMTNMGMPVPQGFTVTTEACTKYYEDGRRINDEIMAEIMVNVEKMEEINGKKFGDPHNPLLVSVRSGARASMPGMMDTILNLGLNDEVVEAMIRGNDDPNFERFVYDSYRRFIQMFSDVVMEVGKKYFEELIDKMKAEKGVKTDIELTAADLTPVFRRPEAPLFVHADGRLAWRAMSNLLSNAVKYAQPGTRFYIDMVALDGKVCISFKNISRAALNVSAEELMERFVRGEASRNQEGSGLGLNIAKSMMELQHGDLELLVDGDLFKATLIFPKED